MSYQLPLAVEANEYRILRSELIEQHGLDEDDQVLLDSLDGQTGIMDQLASMLRRALELDDMASTVATQQKRLADRKTALEDRAARLRRIVIYYLDLIGRKKIEAPDFAYTLAHGRRTLIGDADPAALPDRLVRVKREVNRVAVKQAIEAGENIEGFSLGNGPPHLRSVT